MPAGHDFRPVANDKQWRNRARVAATCRLGVEWRRDSSITGRMTKSGASIAEILADLRSQHQDLDRAIAALAEKPAVDQLQISRLKKRKLRIKDQISYWESRQIPDLDA